jgi:hypothetical protein
MFGGKIFNKTIKTTITGRGRRRGRKREEGGGGYVIYWVFAW